MEGNELSQSGKDNEQTGLQEANQESDSIQHDFADLISQTRAAGGQRIVMQTGQFDHPRFGEIHEEMYAELNPYNQRPIIGVHWILPNGNSLKYEASVVKGEYQDHEQLFVETQMNVDAGHTKSEGLEQAPEFFSERLDEPMAQALANAMGKSVVHTTIDRDAYFQHASPRAKGLDKRGYAARPGRFDTFDRLYQPQVSTQAALPPAEQS